jgi:type II secretory pathway component GspD/PulD (secretin)
LNAAFCIKVAFVAALSMLPLGKVSASSPSTKPAEGATITPNYKDAELDQIIQAVSEATGKNFIIDPRVNAKVTMLSATPMSPAAFYEAFLSVLQVYGYVAVPAGKVIKIVPSTDARQLPSIDLPNNVSSNSDEIVTQIITVKNISAAQLVPLLRPLIPQQGHLAAYANGNMLIISDRASNVVSLATAALEGTSSATTTSSTASTLSSAIPTGATFAVGTYNSKTGKGFAAVIEALRSDSTSNIISTPRIITMNNEEAEVKVTQEIPLITGQYTSSTSSPNGTTSPFETIGVTLRMVPTSSPMVTDLDSPSRAVASKRMAERSTHRIARRVVYPSRSHCHWLGCKPATRAACFESSAPR